MFCFLFGHKYEFVEIKKKYWACCSRCGQLREVQTGGLTKRAVDGAVRTPESGEYKVEWVDAETIRLTPRN